MTFFSCSPPCKTVIVFMLHPSVYSNWLCTIKLYWEPIKHLILHHSFVPYRDILHALKNIETEISTC